MENNETEEFPLVSALMIIDNPDIYNLNNAIKCFQKQTYQYKELIIVNNAKNQFNASGINIEAQKDVFMVDTPHKLNAGQARNYAISSANGQILAQFDMDCWHAPQRLESQIATMATNSAHICVLTKALKYSYNSGRATYWENNKNAILNTMVFSRPAGIDYPAVEKNEEFGILNKMLNSGLQVISMDKPELVCKLLYSSKPIYEITESNLSKKLQNKISKIIKKS